MSPFTGDFETHLTARLDESRGGIDALRDSAAPIFAVRT
jgi:hypothetical protein